MINAFDAITRYRGIATLLMLSSLLLAQPASAESAAEIEAGVVTTLKRFKADVTGGADYLVFIFYLVFPVHHHRAGSAVYRDCLS